jgi:hypothetical protein
VRLRRASRAASATWPPGRDDSHIHRHRLACAHRVLFLARFVAFWWEQAGDELAWDDGRESTVGANWYAWLIFVQHPSVEPYLAPYLLGNSDEEARHALLLDRQDRVLHVGGRVEVTRFLADNAPPAPSVAIEDLQTYMREVLPKITKEEIAERMKEEARLFKELQTWLDSQPSQ